MAEPASLPPIVPHLCVDGASEAIAFYEAAFGGTRTARQAGEDGRRLIHAAMTIHGGEIMLHDEFPEYGSEVMGPTTRGGASVALTVNLAAPAEVDAAMAKAEGAGATILMPAADTFWNARYGRLVDPFGHVWAFNAPLGVPA